MKGTQKGKTTNPRTDRIARHLAAFLDTAQARWAGCMARWTAPLSKRALQFAVVLFCALSGGASLLAIRDAFLQKGPPLVKPATLTVPKYYRQPGPALTPLLTPGDRQHISRFRALLDSLYRSVEGRAIYDSIIRERPGLLDSLRRMEDVYYSPSK